jgi:hypothetical protein
MRFTTEKRGRVWKPRHGPKLRTSVRSVEASIVFPNRMNRPETDRQLLPPARGSIESGVTWL